MNVIYAIYDDEQNIKCLFNSEKDADNHCKHMNKDSNYAGFGLPDEFYVNKVTVH
jgi:hypothetical protein